MTPSSSVDGSGSLDEARTRLLRTARTLNGVWVAALGLVVLLFLASVVALVVATTVHPVYVVIWAVLVAAAGANVTRFWPRQRVVGAGVVLETDEVDRLRRAIDPKGRVAWPDVVRLTARPEIELGGGELLLGMPLLACLDHDELGELLVLGDGIAEVEQERTLRWARRVAQGDLGRSLVGRRSPRLTWPSARLTTLVSSGAVALGSDLEHWARACRREAAAASAASARAQARRDQVAEAWQLLRTEWLEPAFERGRRQVEPFGGLRCFLEAADAAGWLGQRGPRWSTRGAVADIVARHEEQVAASLCGERAERLRPVTWGDHPAEVSVPQWRALVTEVLDATRRTTRDHEVARLDTLLRVLEAGAAPALITATASARGIDTQDARDPAFVDWSERFVPRVLTAAIGVAAVDAGQFRARWSWPAGTSLSDDEGWSLPVEAIVAEVLDMVRRGEGLPRAYGELRAALTELGIDVDEPLWLDHAGGPRPERPIGSFVARQGLASRLVVVTDRALHVFRDPQGPRLDTLVRRADPRDDSFDTLRTRMLTVWQGDTTGEVARVAVADVERARFGPAVGGLWWRLSLGGAGSVLVLRGRRDGVLAEEELHEWLGDRLVTSWLRVPAPLRTARNWLGRVGVPLGVLGLLVSVVLGVTRPGDLAASVWVMPAIAGLTAAGLALLPDLVLDLVQRSPQRESSPTGTSPDTVLPGGANGHAQVGSYAQDGA